MTEPILALPNDAGTYVIDTDASDFGLGAVLSQEQFGTEKVIAYASRTLNTAELKYETTQKELLALVYGLKQFRQYLTGRHFVIRTDHSALSWLRRTPEPMPQLARWLTFIEEFDYEVVHRKGRSHANADGLSRIRPKKPNNDTEPKRDGDTDSESSDAESPETEKAVLNVRPVKADLAENMGTEEESSVREDLAEKQQSNPELGPLVNLRLQSEQKPTIDQLSTEAEGAKRLWNQWERLEVHEGRIYRRAQGRPGELTFRQLLVPRQSVQDVIRSCHEGQTGGHFGISRTLDQVRRRFYWTSWKADTIRFCKRCGRCNEYHRGKLRRKTAMPFTVHIGETPKNWLTEEPKEQTAEKKEQIEQTERRSDTEEENAEKTTPKSRDSSRKSEPPNTHYVVDDTEDRERPKRETQAPKYLREYVRRVSLPKEKTD